MSIEPGKIDDIGFIEKIAETMGRGFGVCDSSGRVLYPVSEETYELPDEDGDIVTSGDRMFCQITCEGRELWFFCDVPEGGQDAKDGAAKALKIASLFYTENVTASFSRRNEFFRQLLLGGKDSVTQGDFTVNTKKNAPAQEYTALLVTLARKKKQDDREVDRMAEVTSLLEYAFPESEGFVTVRIRSDACAVIVPLSEDMQFENALEAAESVIDTVRTELAIDINVSVGCRVKLLRNIDAAYKTAERALAIGEAFDIDSVVYSYDNLGVARILYGQKRDVCESYLREVFGNAFFENCLRVQDSENRSESDDELLLTIKMYLKLNQNVTETAKALFVHRNTLNYRIEKFNKLTGLDCTRFEDGVRISIGFMLVNYLETQLPPGDDGAAEKRTAQMSSKVKKTNKR